MTHKQLKKLAVKMADCERMIQKNSDKDLVTKAQDEIIFLSSQLDLEDLFYLDELLQDMLTKS